MPSLLLHYISIFLTVNNFTAENSRVDYHTTTPAAGQAFICQIKRKRVI